MNEKRSRAEVLQSALMADILRCNLSFKETMSAAMEALARERGLTHSDLVLIEKFLSMKQESRLAVALNISPSPVRSHVSEALNSRQIREITASIGMFLPNS